MNSLSSLHLAAADVDAAIRHWLAAAASDPDALLALVPAYEVAGLLLEAGAQPAEVSSTGSAGAALAAAAAQLESIPAGERPTGLGPAYAALQALRLTYGGSW